MIQNIIKKSKKDKGKKERQKRAFRCNTRTRLSIVIPPQVAQDNIVEKRIVVFLYFLIDQLDDTEHFILPQR